MRTRWILLITLCCTVVGRASDAVPAPKQKKPIALIGGTIHTVGGPLIEKGIVVFDKGKISAIGKEAVVPTEADRIDVTGKHVYPGIIDASTDMGLTEIGSVRGTVDIVETGSINPNARAEVVFHPESELIPVARSGGITVAVSTPAGGLLSGTSAAMMLDGWTGEDATLKAPVGLIVNWPVMIYIESPFSRTTKEDWLKQRDDQLKSLREAFVDARSYAKAKKAEQQKGVPYHKTDMRWEAMIPVLEGRVPVYVQAYELSQIQAAVAWGEQEGVKIVIVGGYDSWRVADQLRSKNIPVIVKDVLSGPRRRWEGYDLVFSLPRKLKDAGIRFCIAGDGSASNSRNVPHHASTAAAFGLSSEDALKSITLFAAQILGIDDRVGSLELGKDATLIVTDGDILELSTSVELVFIQGKRVDMRDKHKQLYEKYKEKYRQLSEQ